MELHTYSFTVSRWTREQNPYTVIADALKQAQAEAALTAFKAADAIPDDEANFYYRAHGAHIDLVVWANSKEDLKDLITGLSQYGLLWARNLQIEVHKRGET